MDGTDNNLNKKNHSFFTLHAVL